MVAVVAPEVVAVVAPNKPTADGPKRDRAAYFRAYRAAKAAQNLPMGDDAA